MSKHPTIQTLALLLALIATPLPTLAQDACVDASAQAQSDPAMNVANSERVFVRVQGFPELSNEYRINPDDTISIPVIGRVSVSGVTPGCLEQRLAEKAKAIAKRDVFLTVETVVYKPVFVTGIIAKPGAIPWFPGMTVLHATTVAGGIFRPQTTITGSNDILRLRRLADNQRRLQARIARLRAEILGEDSLSPPADAGAENSDDTVAVYKTEEILLKSRNAALRNNLATLERSLKVAKEELVALGTTRGSVEEQLRIRRSLRGNLQDLQKRGLVTQPRSLEEDLRVAELEQRVLDNSVARARLGATIAGIEREAGQFGLGRDATLVAEISEAERDLSITTMELREARIATGSQPVVGGESGISYIIIRRISGAPPSRLEAQESDKLQVGDMLIVSYSSR